MSELPIPLNGTFWGNVSPIVGDSHFRAETGAAVVHSQNHFLSETEPNPTPFI